MSHVIHSLEHNLAVSMAYIDDIALGRLSTSPVGVQFAMNTGISISLGKKEPSKLAFGFKGQQKTTTPAVFTADSDNEEEEPNRKQENKRQRRTFTETATPSASFQAQPDEASLTAEEKRTAEKLAEFIAKNGRQFEEITRQRNSQGGPFKFLFDTNSAGFRYYEKKLLEYSTPAQSSNFLGSTPMPTPPLPPSNNHTAQQPRPHHPAITVPAASLATPQQPTLGSASASASALDSSSRSAGGDSIAAMEAAMKLAAEREEARRKQDREDEEAARQPLLNDTSFDRRRVVAVYKDDGSRGHHMQDYIPKEELAKFLAASGSEEAKAQAEAIEAASRIQSDNIGHKLLSQMGWKEGQGLGAQGAGLAAPVTASGAFGTEKRGLGAQDHTTVQEGDDEFETYRKRMMLGYKHRPNPLGNPRKSYY